MSQGTIRFNLHAGVVGMLTLFAGVMWSSPALARKQLPPTHYRIPLDPKATETDLLPTPPKSALSIATMRFDDLARVPEVQLHERWTTPTNAADSAEKEDAPRLFRETEWALIHNARLTTQINFINKKKTDRFIELLMKNRADLAGLPFVMGEACRLKEGERKQFKHAVQMIQFLGNDFANLKEGERWKAYDEARLCKNNAGLDDRICGAACMQMMALQSGDFRLGLVERLAAFDKNDADKNAATQALTNLAVFSQEAEVRGAAIAALQKRGQGADVALLAHGLAYPWPSIAQNAAMVIAELKQQEFIPTLIKVLDEPDPRAPALREVKGKRVPVLREVVKINHLRNCLLCHPPGNTPDVMTFKPWDEKNIRVLAKDVTAIFVQVEKQAEDVLTGAIPTPGEELPSGFNGYGSFISPDILVRADITYLRQDFSLSQKVDNAKPWPEMQRFDYLVRARVLTEKDADACRTTLARLGPASPYHETALDALRRLTGRDAGTTSTAWRAALAKR